MPTNDPTLPAAPEAKRVAHTWHRPTGPVEDPFAWLLDRNDPDTEVYLEAENAYCNAWFAPLEPLVEELFAEIRSRVQETDLSPPVRKGPWWYATRTEEGQAYPVHCRGASPESATDDVLLDQNAEAEGHEYFALDAFDVSQDHSLLAWSSDTNGSERYTLRIRDLTTGTDRPDTIENTTYGGTAWSSDGRHLFYVTPDEAMRPYRVWRHELGTDPSTDVLVHDETDERFFVSVELTRSGHWIVISIGSHTSGEARLIPADDPMAPATLVRPRADNVEYNIDHWGDGFVVLTNEDALDFRVMTAPLDDPGAWAQLVPHVPGRRIVNVQPFEGHLVIHEWVNAQQRLRAITRAGNRLSHEFVFDLGDEPHEVELDANPEWTATALRFRYQSLTTPPTIYEQTIGSDERTILKQMPVLNVDLSRYTSSREWATAPDGTKVPVDIVRRADVAADGTAPCVIYGYGSYEVSLPPWFSVPRLSLLDRGWTWALVHPRGGGEQGRSWYDDGKLLNKANTFTDTIACAEHLLTGWAASVAVRGGSAGGLLVGACMTMRPDLWSAVVAEVPFVDVVSTMSDPSLPLTVTEWEEWGDPREEPYATYIEAYSPYDQTRPGVYPPMFVTAGLNDPRVSYHEPAKWVAKLRTVQQGDAPILLRTEMGAGHGGSSGRYDRWRDEARVMAFLLTVARP